MQNPIDIRRAYVYNAKYHKHKLNAKGYHIMQKPKQNNFFKRPSDGWWARMQAFGAMLVLDGISFIGAHVYLAGNTFAWIGFVLGLLWINEKIVKRIK